jgi:integrase
MIYKILRCKTCSYKKREPKPAKTLGPCPKCNYFTYHASKKWYYDYHLAGRRYEVAMSSDKGITKEAECIKKTEIIRGEAGTPTSWKSGVEELEETYPRLSLKTVEMYQNCVAKLSMSFGSMKLTELTEKHLKDYKSKQLSTGMSASSFNQLRSTLKRIFALSGIDWRFKKSVFTSEKEVARDRILTADERLRLMTACKEVPYLYTVILVALDTGLRKQSILSLKWRDIEWKENQIVKEGKGGKIHRIPLTGRLRQHLKTYRLNQEILSPFVFPSSKSSSCHMMDIRKSIASALTRARLTSVRLHDLRRSFGSSIVMATKDITLASEFLGHADISTTRKHYGHLLNDHKIEGMKIFEEATG